MRTHTFLLTLFLTFFYQAIGLSQDNDENANGNNQIFRVKYNGAYKRYLGDEKLKIELSFVRNGIVTGKFSDGSGQLAGHFLSGRFL